MVSNGAEEAGPQLEPLQPRGVRGDGQDHLGIAGGAEGGLLPPGPGTRLVDSHLPKLLGTHVGVTSHIPKEQYVREHDFHLLKLIFYVFSLLVLELESITTGNSFSIFPVGEQINGRFLGRQLGALLPFLGGRVPNPTKIDYRKIRYSYCNLSTGGPRFDSHLGWLVVASWLLNGGAF